MRALLFGAHGLMLLPLWLGASILLGAIAGIVVWIVNRIDAWWTHRAIDREMRAVAELSRERERHLQAVVSISERRR